MSVPYTKQVAYIESTGTQYIDTGFKPNQDTRVICSFEQITTRSIAASFGCESPRYSAYIISSKFRFDYNSTMTSTQIQVKNNVQHEIDFNKNNVYLDGMLNTTFTYGNFTAPNLLLFRTTYGGSYFYGRIYWCKVYDNSVLVRDFIPVRVNETGYLYDKVSGELFGNAGSGNFVLGNDIIPHSGFLPFRRRLLYTKQMEKLPDGVKRVQYLQCTGSQYIDTLVLPAEDVTFVIDAMYTELTGSAPGNGFLTNDTNNVRFHDGIYLSKFHFGIGTKWINTMQSDTNRHIFSFSGNGEIKLDDDSYSISDVFSRTENLNNLLLFGQYILSTNKVDWSVRYMNNYTVFKSSIYKNGELVRDFIPVQKEGVGYMYDKISGQLFGNQGTGEFIIGK